MNFVITRYVILNVWKLRVDSAGCILINDVGRKTGFSMEFKWSWTILLYRLWFYVSI